MKITQRQLVLNFMKRDIPFHLTEISEGCKIPYYSVSKAVDDLLKANLIERVLDNPGAYIRYTKKGKIKAQLSLLADEITKINTTMQNLKEQRDNKIEYFKSLKEKYEKLLKESNL